MKQCKKCPWRVDVDPHDIPNGYCETKHAALESTIARGFNVGQPLHITTCHESPTGNETPCVGWLSNQIGVGNNIALRMWASKQPPFKIKLVGEQHACFEDTLP